MDRTKKLLGNISVFAISSFSSKLLTFLLLPFYTAYLTTGEFGDVDLVFSVISLISPIFTVEICSSVFRFTIDNEKDPSRFFTNGLTVILGGFVILLLLFPVFAGSGLAEGYLHLFYIHYICGAICSLLGSYARGLQRIKFLGVCGIVHTAIVVVSNVLLLAVFRLGVRGYIYASILGNLLTTVIYIVGLRKSFTLRARDVSVPVIKEMAKYSLPLAPNNVAWWGVSSANKFVIQAALSSEVLGLYSAALRIPSIINVLNSIVSEGMVLSILDQYRQDDPDTKYYSMLYKLYSSFSIFIVAAVIIFCRLICTILFAQEFREAWVFVPLLCITPLWGSLSGFLGTFYAASKKNQGMFISVVLGAAVAIAVGATLIHAIGIYAVMVGNILAYFLIWLYRWLNVKRIIQLKVNLASDVISWILLIGLAVLTMQVSNLPVLIGLDVAALLVLAWLNREVIGFVLARVQKMLKRK